MPENNDWVQIGADEISAMRLPTEEMRIGEYAPEDVHISFSSPPRTYRFLNGRITSIGAEPIILEPFANMESIQPPHPTLSFEKFVAKVFGIAFERSHDVVHIKTPRPMQPPYEAVMFGATHARQYIYDADGDHKIKETRMRIMTDGGQPIHRLTGAEQVISRDLLSIDEFLRRS